LQVNELAKGKPMMRGKGKWKWSMLINNAMNINGNIYGSEMKLFLKTYTAET
jgi:hypothetical protein